MQNLASNNSLVTRPSDNVIYYNARYADLTRPMQGPANPWDDGKLEKQNALTGASPGCRPTSFPCGGAEGLC